MADIGKDCGRRISELLGVSRCGDAMWQSQPRSSIRKLESSGRGRRVEHKKSRRKCADAIPKPVQRNPCAGRLQSAIGDRLASTVGDQAQQDPIADRFAEHLHGTVAHRDPTGPRMKTENQVDARLIGAVDVTELRS